SPLRRSATPPPRGEDPGEAVLAVPILPCAAVKVASSVRPCQVWLWENRRTGICQPPPPSLRDTSPTDRGGSAGIVVLDVLILRRLRGRGTTVGGGGGLGG